MNELSKQIKATTDRIEEITKVNKAITDHNSEIIKHQTSITAIQKYIEILNSDIEKLSSKGEVMENDNTKLKQFKGELGVLVEKQKNVVEEKQYYDFAATLLKDSGIKTKIIKQYLPVMNKLINKYLTQMNFFVNFNINENFEETIKSRYRDDFSYYNFSEGEKFRIDLALLFTWRQIAKLKNSASSNLLILDEVFDSSLDNGGTDEFMKLINELGPETHVFVVSHKGDALFDKFRSIIKFEKKNSFSYIVK
jgi:DNA repair exonuclease SbcCD ATPase subunit